eukprot:Plantae.Rhodophyta-Purpureofilum_apyrenoidigerum.ctg21750.p1 GENE.Plantae.Rhodophyta-Purpureofilum_apyrenoidigerum.ctg21750~~Plantae.Rhodophyta-Purpureofilum_apyrenoidigerum.ctg21750.p1  ORF type:complete len:309 (-),score=55.31 Plantae.Rhodophyta-Purpureofilum_apyrenoidigerum.ctg21750:102-914(-)
MATCPLGYGGGKAQSGPMACSRCQAVCFNPRHAVPCECVYCADCLEGVRDCNKCARDVEGSKSGEDFQKKIDVFVSAHAPKAPHELGMFWLGNAVKHERSANFFAADARYNEALDAFRKDEGSREEVAICMSKLAELRWQHLNDRESAREAFQEAITILSDIGAPKLNSLAVTTMKWGAFEHANGDKERALKLFRNALSIRETAFRASECTKEDICSCYFAIGNTQLDLGDSDGARQSFNQTLQILGEETSLSDRGKTMKEESENKLKAL